MNDFEDFYTTGQSPGQRVGDEYPDVGQITYVDGTFWNRLMRGIFNMDIRVTLLEWVIYGAQQILYFMITITQDPYYETYSPATMCVFTLSLWRN